MPVKKKKAEDEEKFASGEEDEESEEFYDEDDREEMLENDEITAGEEGFMRGWDGEIEGGKKRKRASEHKDEVSGELIKEQYQED
ncbi:MAG: hypothetical protein A4E32_01613 [Methanomassiliicoccales archaeon PtaU1.Bin124]|nr:MAG: hypothetical protein A4E32_01613 [Methanomassiliicoccales archaeon PtaU1.Bin124]